MEAHAQHAARGEPNLNPNPYPNPNPDPDPNPNPIPNATPNPTQVVHLAQLAQICGSSGAGRGAKSHDGLAALFREVG